MLPTTGLNVCVCVRERKKKETRNFVSVDLPNVHKYSILFLPLLGLFAVAFLIGFYLHLSNRRKEQEEKGKEKLSRAISTGFSNFTSVFPLLCMLTISWAKMFIAELKRV